MNAVNLPVQPGQNKLTDAKVIERSEQTEESKTTNLPTSNPEEKIIFLKEYMEENGACPEKEYNSLPLTRIISVIEKHKEENKSDPKTEELVEALKWSQEWRINTLRKS